MAFCYEKREGSQTIPIQFPASNRTISIRSKLRIRNTTSSFRSNLNSKINNPAKALPTLERTSNTHRHITNPLQLEPATCHHPHETNMNSKPLPLRVPYLKVETGIPSKSNFRSLSTFSTDDAIFTLERAEDKAASNSARSKGFLRNDPTVTSNKIFRDSLKVIFR